MFEQLVNFPLIKNLFSALKKSDSDQVLLVGGIVRDFILYGKIAKDIDVATNLSVEDIIQRLPNVGDGKMLTNAISYGSVSFFIDGYGITVTRFRKDVETFGRFAVVESVDSIELDASRRDFTMNALYLDEGGALIDFFGGIDDLQRGIVKFIGDACSRILEDYLRILRFFRFSSRFTNEYLEEVLVVISGMLDGLNNVSAERITTEVKEIVRNKFAVSALKKMFLSGVLDAVFGGGVLLDFDMLERMLEIFHNDEHLQPNPIYGLLPFFLSISEKNVDQAFSKLVFSNAEKLMVKVARENSELFFVKSPSAKNLCDAVRICYKNSDFYNALGLNISCGDFLKKVVSDYVKMPFTGADVLESFPKIDKKKLRDLLLELQSRWIISGYSLSHSDFLRITSEFLH